MKNLILIIVLISIFSCHKEIKNIKASGPVFGTSYSIIYNAKSSNNFQKQFDSLFYVINNSMSNYQPNSDISKLNRNEAIDVDSHFEKVFKASKKIFNETEGVFDPTIGKLVNAWNFGSEENNMKLDSIKIDSLMQFVGFEKMKLSGKKILKEEPKPYIDFNAIAKGYGIDVIAEFLERKGIDNYLVEIGGEVRAKGINLEKNSEWCVGLQDPNFNGETSYSKSIPLKDASMATSGTYRKFKLDENGNRYAHIINANTGYPTKTNVLSVSVIAENCMLADGYATAFQAMGIEKVKRFLTNHPELKVYFIFENENKVLETLALNGFMQ